MTNSFGVLRAPRRDGSEPFHQDAAPLPFALRDFWAWSVSDLVSNATRGRLAEYLVAKALGVSTAGVREEWAACDLVTRGGTRIEVKSAAYLQAWSQRRPSRILFSTRPSRAWDPETGVMGATATRSSDVYVFALLHHLDKATLDPLNVAQWTFHVVATSTIASRTRSQHSITLASLERLAPALRFHHVAPAVAACDRDAMARHAPGSE
jgi:hypothetical protein